jgi:hypothetical protein
MTKTTSVIIALPVAATLGGLFVITHVWAATAPVPDFTLTKEKKTITVSTGEVVTRTEVVTVANNGMIEARNVAAGHDDTGSHTYTDSSGRFVVDHTNRTVTIIPTGLNAKTPFVTGPGSRLDPATDCSKLIGKPGGLDHATRQADGEILGVRVVTYTWSDPNTLTSISYAPRLGCHVMAQKMTYIDAAKQPQSISTVTATKLDMTIDPNELDVSSQPEMTPQDLDTIFQAKTGIPASECQRNTVKALQDKYNKKLPVR